MGDVDQKVGDIKEEDIVGLFGWKQRNKYGQKVVEDNLIIANTWFQT